MKAAHPYTARLPLREGIRDIFCSRLAHLPDSLQLIRNEPDKLVQRRLNGLEHEFAAIANYLYAFGYPLPSVCQALASSALAARKVFQLRGTEAPFFVLDVTLKSNGTAEKKPRHPPGSKDFSVTNSANNLAATAISLCAGRFDLAKDISSMAWDPPNASYLSDARGSYCTRNDQRLAYALREYYIGNLDEARRLLTQVRTLPRHHEVRAKAAMIGGLIEREPERFLHGIEEYLPWFDKEPVKQDSECNPAFFLATLPLGLATLAVREGVVSPEQLPRDNPRFSCELVQLALQEPYGHLTELLELDL